MKLSEYQKATVEHLEQVYKKQKAYIVADEVGLGKTYVAIGLIEKLKAKRIIYIASNAEIAKQNVDSIIEKSNISVNKSNIRIEKVPGDRLSMINTTSLSLSGRYIISLSPATTFTGIGSPAGTAEERAYYINFFEDHIKYNKKINGMTADEVEKCLEELKAYNNADRLMRNLSSEQMKKCISKCRKLFNNYNLEKYEPDLIIMDEFHRFHSLLAKEPQDENAYSMWKSLEKSNCKVLLLSATPYTYSQDKIIRKYNMDAEKVEEEEKDPDKAFGNFIDLINYLNDINGHPSIDDIPDITTIYETIMCRTQRNWIQNASTSVKKDIRPVITESDASIMVGHFEYLSQMRDSLKISEVIEKRKKGELTSDRAYGSYLDQASAFEQFGEKYKFSEYGNGNDSLEKKRKEFSEELKKKNYLIRKKNPNRDDFQIESNSFAKCLKDYKTQKLIKLAMPAQCEMLLWVLPTILQSAASSEWKPLGIEEENMASLKLFSKTLVFAHYRLSTAAICAITSMEANRRLDAIIDAALESNNRQSQIVKEILEQESNLPEKVLDIMKEVIPDLTIDENVIKKETENFFGTSYAKKVLAAWSWLVNNSSNMNGPCITYENVIEKYVENFKFKEMLIEYRDLVGNDFEKTIFSVKKEKKNRPGSIGWSDEERTKVIVFPDFVDKTYPLTFSERYYSDYSDKSSHDKGDKKNYPRLSTTKRLEAIRIRFQSPFYPFILAASETAQEGVDLHNYCLNIIHWSVPSSVRVYTQEEGRVDRRGSLAIRRQMIELFNCWHRSKLNTVEEIFDKASEICKDLGLGENIELAEKAGLFPKWFLPTDEERQIFHRLNSQLFYIPFGKEYEAYKDLAYYMEQYVTFGIKKTSGEMYSNDELKQGLCPFYKY